MSRAFVREPDSAGPVCPGCGAAGEPVGPVTMASQLPPNLRTPLGEAAFYCANPACPTAYFNAWGAAVPAGNLASPAYPKDPAGPVCPCFGVTAAEIVADARAGRKERVRDLAERAQGPDARCAESRPDGRTCLPLILRLFRESFENR